MDNILIEVAFYKGLYSHNLISIIIAIFTLSKYSHVELIIDGMSYSSRPSSKGVSKELKDYSINPELWDILLIKISEESILKILQFFNETNHAKYDWVGIFFYHLIPLEIEDPNRYYCSEWVAKALRFQYPKFFKKFQMTPGKIFKKLKRISQNIN